jgi:hypothetical protein
MKTESNAATILERLARLERHNIRLRAALIVFGGMAGIGVLAGAAAPAAKTIEAQGFILVDQDGRHRAELSMQPDGTGVRLAFLDEHGAHRLQLNANKDDAGLSLIEGGELRATLNARVGKHVMLLVQKEKFDKQRNQMGFGFMDDGKPRIFVNDADARTILSQP